MSGSDCVLAEFKSSELYTGTQFGDFRGTGLNKLVADKFSWEDISLSDESTLPKWHLTLELPIHWSAKTLLSFWWFSSIVSLPHSQISNLMPQKTEQILMFEDTIQSLPFIPKSKNSSFPIKIWLTGQPNHFYHHHTNTSLNDPHLLITNYLINKSLNKVNH